MPSLGGDLRPRPSREHSRAGAAQRWNEPLRAQRDPLAEDAGRVRASRDEHRHLPRQSWLGRFVATYGWRAYALPVLAVVTGLVSIKRSPAPAWRPPQTRSTPCRHHPPIGSQGTEIIGAPPRGLTKFDVNLPTGILPEGGPFTEAGNKAWRTVPGTDPQVGQGTAKVFHHTVEIEDGGGHRRLRRRRRLRGWSQTLSNPKSWTHNPQFAFVRVDDSSRPRPISVCR